MGYQDEQKEVATGVTDGTVKPWLVIQDLTESLRHHPDRNAVLEEVAIEFDNMKPLGDTAASFAAFVRGMKT